MAKIDIKDSVKYDRETVYTTFRDNLIELLPYLPDVKDIEQSQYDRDGDVVNVVNTWFAKEDDIPAVASKFIKPEMLQWVDTATWRDDEYSVEWDMEVGFMKEAVSCSGKTTYKEKGDKTEVHILGELQIDAKKIPGVPRLIAGKVGDAVEKFVVKMITPNMTDVNRGVEKYLATKE